MRLARFRHMILNNRTRPVHHPCVVITTIFNRLNGNLQSHKHDV